MHDPIRHIHLGIIHLALLGCVFLGALFHRFKIMNQSYTSAERAHVEAVKCLPCSVCDKQGPSAAHHIRQSDAYSCVALCQDCHQGSLNGWHGRKAIWRVKKMDELDALTITFRRLLS